MAPDRISHRAFSTTRHSQGEMPVSLKNVLEEAAKNINFIKSRPLNPGF